MPELGTVRICIVADSSDDQVLGGILQASRLRLQTENALLVRQLVPSRSVAYQMMAGGNQAIMNYRDL